MVRDVRVLRVVVGRERRPRGRGRGGRRGRRCHRAGGRRRRGDVRRGGDGGGRHGHHGRDRRLARPHDLGAGTDADGQRRDGERRHGPRTDLPHGDASRPRPPELPPPHDRVCVAHTRARSTCSIRSSAASSVSLRPASASRVRFSPGLGVEDVHLAGVEPELRLAALADAAGGVDRHDGLGAQLVGVELAGELLELLGDVRRRLVRDVGVLGVAEPLGDVDPGVERRPTRLLGLVDEARVLEVLGADADEQQVVAADLLRPLLVELDRRRTGSAARSPTPTRAGSSWAASR